jgi:hypothetical protein
MSTSSDFNNPTSTQESSGGECSRQDEPPRDPNRIGLDDYLLTHTKEEFEALPYYTLEDLEPEFEPLYQEWLRHNQPPIACDHTEVLDLLNQVIDQHAEVGSRLEIIARALVNGAGR